MKMFMTSSIYKQEFYANIITAVRRPVIKYLEAEIVFIKYSRIEYLLFVTEQNISLLQEVYLSS